MEQGAYSKDQDDYGDAIGHLAVFDELEAGVFEDAAGQRCQVFEVPVLVGIEVGDQSGYEDTAEQREQDTEDLRGSETQNGAQPEIEKDECREQRSDVGVQHGRQGAPVTIAHGNRVAFPAVKLFLDPLEDN